MQKYNAGMMIAELSGQGVKQFAELGLAFLLSAVIVLEREIRHKSAGLRTYTIIGTAAALFLLISKYGFTDVLVEDRIVLDPSRVAAQIVSGIGIIGAGLIFVREDKVNGLTTAATVWLVTAIGMACGVGLPILALVVTGAYFVVALAHENHPEDARGNSPRLNMDFLVALAQSSSLTHRFRGYSLPLFRHLLLGD
jgi:putative Mg2+ transporter-C (MgtC) family protein